MSNSNLNYAVAIISVMALFFLILFALGKRDDKRIRGSTDEGMTAPQPQRKEAIGLAFAGIVMLATVVNAAVAWAQWDVFRGQLAMSQAEQRPWIKVEPIIDGDSEYVAGEGISFPVHFRFVNVGHTPAFEVRTLVNLYYPKLGSKFQDPESVWKDQCNKFTKNIPKSNSSILMAGEAEETNKTSPDILELSIKQMNEATARGESRNASLYIFGCVDLQNR